jgi:hypothetical protein
MNQNLSNSAKLQKQFVNIFLFLVTTSIMLIPGAQDCYGQTITFQKTFGGLEAEYLNSVVQTPDNGYIAVGSKRISPNEYIYIVRFNAFGDSVWTKIIPGDDAMCVIKTIDGHYALCDINGRIFKFDINGNILVTGGLYDIDSRVLKLIQNQNGDYFLCGGYFPSYYRPYLMKLNENGVYQWDSVYSDGFYDGNFRDMIISNGKIVLTGSYSETSNLTQNVFIIMLSFNGERLFFNSGYNELYIHPTGLLESQTGSFIICGTFRINNHFIAKYSNTGMFEWIRAYDTNYRGSSKSITLDSEGNYVYTGSILDEALSRQFVVLRKTDTNGIEVWNKRYEIKGQSQRANDIKLTSDSGFVVAGVTSTFSQGDVYLLKTDKNGDLLPPIGIEPISNEIPLAFHLYQNYPNPFNPATKIKFDIPVVSYVEISIYDVNGKFIQSLLENELAAGKYIINFSSNGLSSGIYFYRLIAANNSNKKHIQSRKLILLK